MGGPFESDEFFERFFEDGRPFENRRPFESDEFFERFFEELEEFFENGSPFDFEGGIDGDSDGTLRDFFRDAEREFRFRGDGGDGSQGSFCFSDGDEEQCFSDLDQLSDEEREQLEQMLEMLDGFGPGGFLGGLLDSLDDLEFEFPESQTDPSAVTGA